MHYTVDIELELPLARVIELFDDPRNLVKWQEGLLSFEHLSGTPGRPGAKSRLVFQMGRRRIEMIETVTVRDLPVEFSGTYEAPGVFNVVQNRFYEIGPNRTRWESENDFEFAGLMMRIIGLLFKSAFPKQSLKYMQDFKAFAEHGHDVRERGKKSAAPGT